MTVLGLPLILANLSRIAAEIVTMAEPEGLSRGAEVIREAWVSNIESESLILSGHYRDSVRVEMDGEMAAVVTDVPYAPILEFGDSRQAAHHVAERAFDEHHEEATEHVGDAIRKVIR